MKSLVYEVFIQYKIPILIALISEIIILFIFSCLSVYLFPQSRAAILNIWDLWNVWDAPHYISIAEHGYQIEGDPANFIVFLPLLPLLIYLSNLLFHINFLIGGYLVSFVATIILAVMLYKLFLLDYSKSIALYAVLVLFIFPTSFFLHIPYTESIFILLSVSAFYFIRKKLLLIGFIFAGLATFTKIAGLALLPAILIEILFFNEKFRQKSFYSKFIILFFGLIIVISGFLIYLFINYYLWKDFFYFSIVQKQHWYVSFAPLGQGLVNAYNNVFLRQGLEKFMLGYAQIIAFILGFIMSFYVLFKVRLSYGIYSVLVLFISYSMSFWLSMPRFILSLFPMYIVIALFFRYRIFKFFWILFSTILLILLSLIFIQFGPVF